MTHEAKSIFSLKVVVVLLNRMLVVIILVHFNICNISDHEKKRMAKNIFVLNSVKFDSKSIRIIISYVMISIL